MDRAASAQKSLQTYGFVALSSENDPFAQAEAPNALHRHGNEFTDHLRATERRSRPAYEPGAEQEVPNIQGDKQRHATPEVARRFERELRFIRKLNEPEHTTAMPFATPVGNAS